MASGARLPWLRPGCGLPCGSAARRPASWDVCAGTGPGDHRENDCPASRPVIRRMVCRSCRSRSRRPARSAVQPPALDDDGLAVVVDRHPHGPEGAHGGHVVAAAQKPRTWSCRWRWPQHDRAVRDGFVAGDGDLPLTDAAGLMVMVVTGTPMALIVFLQRQSLLSGSKIFRKALLTRRRNESLYTSNSGLRF